MTRCLAVEEPNSWEQDSTSFHIRYVIKLFEVPFNQEVEQQMLKFTTLFFFQSTYMLNQIHTTYVR